MLPETGAGAAAPRPARSVGVGGRGGEGEEGQPDLSATNTGASVAGVEYSL